MGWTALSIANYNVLIYPLGTTYGGDGQTTYPMPDLRDQKLIHGGSGAGFAPGIIGDSGGSETQIISQ